MFLICGDKGRYRLLGNPEHVISLVVSHNAVHLLKVAHIAGTDSLPAIYPQLAEVNGAAVEVRHIGHQQHALALPAGNRHAAADDGLRTRRRSVGHCGPNNAQAAVFRAQA